MLYNTPQTQILDDQDHQTVVKITGYYNAATNANTLVVQANSLFGANASLPCILGLNSIEYSTSINNGFVALEWVSTANQNTTITSAGRFNDGAFARYIPNNANTPTGDENLVTQGLAPGDSYTLIVSFLKEYQGQNLRNNNYLGPVANTVNYGAGAWANAVAAYRNPGGY